jgi:hypothetical protein
VRGAGELILALASRVVDAATVDALITPTIADLQYEVACSGHDAWRSAAARLRGYAAVARLVMVNSVVWRSPMRRLFSVVTLGLIGAVLFYLPLPAGSTGPARLIPFLLMALATPLVLRQLNLATSFRQTFNTCFAAGAIMGGSFLALELGRASLSRTRPLPWPVLAFGVCFLTLCVAGGSALVAAVAVSGRSGSIHRVFRRIAAGASIYALFDVALRLYSGANVERAVGWAFFLALYFGCFSLAIHVPILTGIRRLVVNPLASTLVGALLCPLPLMLFPILQGRFAASWDSWLLNPSSFVFGAIPFLVGGAVLGWLTAAGGRRTQPAA